MVSFGWIPLKAFRRGRWLRIHPPRVAGVRDGDHLLAINGSPVTRQVQVTKRLWRAGLWTQVRYRLLRNGEEFETPLVTAPAEKPTSIENYERMSA